MIPHRVLAVTKFSGSYNKQVCSEKFDKLLEAAREAKLLDPSATPQVGFLCLSQLLFNNCFFYYEYGHYEYYTISTKSRTLILPCHHHHHHHCYHPVAEVVSRSIPSSLHYSVSASQ